MLVGLVLVAGCGRSHAPVIAGAGTTGPTLRAAVAAVCRVRDDAAHGNVGAARDGFFVRAHQRLHEEALGLERVERAAAADLLVAMEKVEADFASQPPAAAPLVPDLATLTATAGRGLSRLAVTPPPCAR